MAKNLPWFAFYARDWTDDPELNLCQHATQSIWLRALCAMHLSDTSSLTGTSEQLSRVLHCSVSEVRSAALDLKASRAADVNERDGNITLTCRRRVKELHIRELRSKAGSISAAKRKQDGQQPYDSDCDSGIPGNGDARGKGEPRPGFERFWSAWPKNQRKAGKPQCIDKWDAKGLEEKADEIVGAVEANKARNPDWLKSSGAFIPAPMVWLNQERWNAPLLAGKGTWRSKWEELPTARRAELMTELHRRYSSRTDVSASIAAVMSGKQPPMEWMVVEMLKIHTEEK